MPKTRKNAATFAGDRIAAYCRTVFPRHTAKFLQREFGCSIDTAEKWVRGNRPSNEHFDQMVEAWGPEFIAHVYEPVIGSHPSFVVPSMLERIADLIGDVRVAVDVTKQASFRREIPSGRSSRTASAG